jgi:cob(I)alamin adenosyltransferase
MKIYTKGGDNGTTSLIGGKRVPKYHERIETYGTVDELISFIGLIRDQPVAENVKASLILIQDRLMTCASLLAAEDENSRKKLPVLRESDLEYLEKEIDAMEKKLPPLSSFILPGGHTYGSYCHIARNICRRAERSAIQLSVNNDVPALIIKYLNRLSDYMFVLARKLTLDFHGVEIPWKPKL